MSDLYKYPSTFHLPWSPHNAREDYKLKDTEHFYGEKVVVTEKMDGENTTLYRNHIHARSLSSSDHPSRSWVKGLWGQIRHLIPSDMRICGENLYAQHSIYYKDLSSYFLVFNIWVDQECLSWDETLKICSDLNLATVPVLFWGTYTDYVEHDFLRKLNMSGMGWEREGYVVRLEDSFHLSNWDRSIAKYVRPHHVQTNDHWMYKEMVVNKLCV